MKSIDEQIFFTLMRMPMFMRKSMAEAGFEMPGQGFGRRPGMEGLRRPEGRGPERGPGFGEGRPEGRGPERGPGFGEGRGHGFDEGRSRGFGPAVAPGSGTEGSKGFGPGPGEGRKGHGRPLSRERILGVLLDSDAGMRQKEIAEKLRIGAPAISEFINKLEASGYIERTVDPEDKRATLISLTELGRARAFELEDEKNERFAAALSRLNEEEKVQLLALLRKLIGRDEAAEETFIGKDDDITEQ